MTENRRIVCNVLATYGRSLVALACAIFTSRWVLMSLGEVDYGLLGVVGSLMAFVGFLNGVLSACNCRFYAHAVGRLRSAADSAAALEECRRWFSLSVTVHVAVPILLMAVGWPLGEWAVRNWLTIPAARLDACIAVFRISCFGCFVSMVTVPFSSMYTAKQRIVELTLYSFASTVCTFALAGYMIVHPGDWLLRFALLTCLIGAVPSVLLAVRAVQRFPECRIRRAYLFDRVRMRELLAFSGWAFFGMAAGLLRVQGVMILLNRSFGPVANAAMSLARNVNDKANMLSVAIKGAIAPAIVQAYGAGETLRMRVLVFRMCKFSLLATLVVVIPLVLELPELLRLWLRTPPRDLEVLAICVIVEYVVEVATCGYDTSVYAVGRIAKYLLVAGAFALLTLPAACAVVLMGGGVTGVGWTVAAMTLGYSVIRVRMATLITGMGFREWVLKLVVPAAAVTAGSVLAGLLPRWLGIPQGPLRILLTAGAAGMAFLPLAWFLALDSEERVAIVGRLHRILAGIMWYNGRKKDQDHA